MTLAERLQPFQTGPQSPLWRTGEPGSLGAVDGTLVDGLMRTARRWPDRVAIHYHGARITYGRLLADVEAMAGALAAQGLRPGDRVIIDMQNSPQFIIAFHAVLRANGVVVPVNPMNTLDEIAYFATDSGARLAIVGEELLDRFTPHLGTLFDGLIRARYVDMADPDAADLPDVMRAPRLPDQDGCIDMADLLARRLDAPDFVAGPDDLAILPYSSGTTGRPKACMHLHRGAHFVAAAQVRWYGIDETSVMTCFMPLFHVAGMMASMATGLLAGASLIVTTRWNAAAIPDIFRTLRPTWWSAAPTMVVDVLASPGFDGDVFSSLKVMTGGGSSMPAAVANRLLREWGLRFCEGYGLTETISATHINALDAPRPQCLGLPIHDTHAIVVDPDTLAPLEQGQAGEILISGPQVMAGYWNRPEATAETLIERDGRIWLRTGDLGHVDGDGCFFITDRIKRMINVSGYKVWPAEVEMTLHDHPAVAECAVISAPDPRRGEVARAIIVPVAGMTLTSDQLQTFVRERLAAYKVPRQIEFREALPRSGTRKVDWRSLQTEAWRESE